MEKKNYEWVAPTALTALGLAGVAAFLAEAGVFRIGEEADRAAVRMNAAIRAKMDEVAHMVAAGNCVEIRAPVCEDGMAFMPETVRMLCADGRYDIILGNETSRCFLLVADRGIKEAAANIAMGPQRVQLNWHHECEDLSCSAANCWHDSHAEVPISELQAGSLRATARTTCAKVSELSAGARSARTNGKLPMDPNW